MQHLSSSFLSDRISHPINILQFGGGNFLRAFVNWMIERLNSETDFRGGVAIVKPTERGDYDSLRKQDGLFHVLLNGIQKGEYVQEKTLVQCVQKIIHPYKEWDAYLKLAEDPNIRFIISNTTEAGITFSSADRHLVQPATEFPGKLTQWLYHRFLHFRGDPDKNCIILPLELIEKNGQKLQACIHQYANHWKLGPFFFDWIKKQSFCDTLVDRIVSGYPSVEEVKQFEREMGVKDELLVVGEPYHSWVIQGPEHVQQELPFSQTDLNVKFVKDLEAYREIKVRILNGMHTSMVPMGYLAGARTVLEVMEKKELREFLQQELHREIIPTLEISDEELKSFARDVFDRFRNPSLKHKLIDIALNSTSKFSTRLQPSLEGFYEKQGILPKHIAFALAALIRFYKGEWQGETIALRDDAVRLAFFKELWEEEKDTRKLVDKVLGNEEIWGKDLNEMEGLADLVSSYLVSIHTQFSLPKIDS